MLNEGITGTQQQVYVGYVGNKMALSRLIGSS